MTVRDGRHLLARSILLVTLLGPSVVSADGDPSTVATPERDPSACTDPGGDLGPAMIVIPPGHYRMGTLVGEKDRSVNESPQHWVTIQKPFALSRCEITVAQFRRFVDEMHFLTTAEKAGGQGCNVWNAETKKGEWRKDRNWQNPGFPQTDEHPVVCVSHADAEAYAVWLSQRTGAQYRLPTEAEWEFAARATPVIDRGVETARYWGDDPDTQQQCAHANGADQSAKSLEFSWTLADCSDGYAYTAPVASFRPTALGLYDVAGNVWEWTADCWHASYEGAPSDGSAWTDGKGADCGRRVVRGGSWDGIPQYLRSGVRFRDSTVVAYNVLGFRLSRAF